MRDRLIELLKPHVSGTACLYESGSCELTSCRDCKARQLADYLLANGVIVPPCKVGDTVYRIYTRSWVGEDTVCEFHIFGGTLYYTDDKNRETSCDQFGKTVFLTKEEAEKKLKELTENV